MQTKKMSLANIRGKLSRSEMKSIMAGSATCTSYCRDVGGIMCGSYTCTSVGVPGNCIACNGYAYCC